MRILFPAGTAPAERYQVGHEHGRINAELTALTGEVMMPCSSDPDYLAGYNYRYTREA